MKEEALDRMLWRTRFGRGCGLVARQADDDDDDSDGGDGGGGGGGGSGMKIICRNLSLRTWMFK